MESRRRAAPLPENRTRTKNLVVRLSERERAMLDAVAAHEQMSASEAFRWLVRRAFEQQETAPLPLKSKREKAAAVDRTRRKV